MSKKIRFVDVNVGDKFIACGIECVKINDVHTNGKELSKLEANAMSLSDNHHCVIGDNVLCKIIEDDIDQDD